MRFIAAIVVSALLLGSVGICQYLLTRSVDISIAREVHGHNDPFDPAESAPYTLRLTPAFDATRDPFALAAEPGSETPRIIVKHDGKALLAWSRDVRRGIPLTLTNLTFQGNSAEFHVEATPSADDARRPVALRVELLQDGTTCADETIWSPGEGHNLSARVDLSLLRQLGKLDRGLQGASANE